MRKDVVCLYERNGLSAEMWAASGCDVYHYDKATLEPRVETYGMGRKYFIPWDAADDDAVERLVAKHAGRCAIVLAYPPCDDLAVSGAKHFWEKERMRPGFQMAAMRLVYAARDIAVGLSAPYAIENPVSMIATFWRKPDVMFNPSDYGGYLPEDDVHPVFPEYIPPRDAYKKRTCYWTGNGFRMPAKKPVPVIPDSAASYYKLGGKTEKTKRIRSMSPRGVGIGIYYANYNPNE